MIVVWLVGLWYNAGMVTVMCEGATHRLDGLAGAIVKGVVAMKRQLAWYGDKRVKVEINRAGGRLVIKPILYDDEVRVEI